MLMNACSRNYDPYMARENHKQQLLDGALECLRTRGYARTTARDIAAAAGANIGSIGYHYGSKDALLTEALQEGFRAWTAHLSSRVGAVEAANPVERLRLSWDTMLAELAEQEGLLQAFLEALAPASRSPELRAQLASLYRELRDEVAAIAAQSLPDTSEGAAAARVVSSLLIAVFDGLQLQWFLEPAETPSADAIGQALAVTAAALMSSMGEGS